MKKIFYFIILILSLINFSYGKNNLTIDIDSSEVKKIHLVFEKINSIDGNSDSRALTNKVFTTVENNLLTTNLFLIQNSGDSVFDDYESVKNLSSIDLANLVISKYNRKSVDAILSGFVETKNNGEIELKIRLWDILDQRELFAKYYVIDKSNTKRVGDIISDIIYELLTGESSGHFDTKIIYVSETGPARERKKRITICDFDGSNSAYITNGENLVLTPIFSKFNKGEIIYLEYQGDNKPHLFKYNLVNNKLEMIGNMKEMTFAPNFNPSGLNEIIFSATNNNGESNIFKLDFNEKKIKQLTFDSAIDTVPSYSPDGQNIVFVSDKTGIRKLYMMDKDGENVKLISNGRGVYDKPSWSPDGKLISFVKIYNGEFSVGLMTPDGENERSIISAYLVEGVKWSPNGRYLIYSKQKSPFGKASIPGIYTVDILTGKEHKIPTPDSQGATDPDWIKK